MAHRDGADISARARKREVAATNEIDCLKIGSPDPEAAKVSMESCWTGHVREP